MNQFKIFRIVSLLWLLVKIASAAPTAAPGDEDDLVTTPGSSITQQRSDDIFNSTAVSPLLQERQTTEDRTICFDCIILTLLSTTGETKAFAYGVCEPVCGAKNIRLLGRLLGITIHTATYAARLGWDWTYGHGWAQRQYMAWFNAPDN